MVETDEERKISFSFLSMEAETPVVIITRKMVRIFIMRYKEIYCFHCDQD